MPRINVGDQYYTASEVKAKLGITQGTLYNYVRNGYLKPIVPPGKRQGVYLRKEIDQLARETQAFLEGRNLTPATFGRVSKEDVAASVELTRKLFGLRGSVEENISRRLEWIAKNPDILYVLKAEDQLVGYAILLPLKLEKIYKILDGLEFSQEVKAEEVETFEAGHVVSIYLMGIGVTPGLSIGEKRVYGSRLISGLMEVIIDLGRRGVIIETLIARSDTPDGIRLLKRGFTQVPSMTHTRNFIIKVEESGLPVILEYKKAFEQRRMQHLDS